MDVGVALYLVLSLGVMAGVVSVIAIYYQMVLDSVNADTAWANISILLKQRRDDIPLLVAVCKEHMEQEREPIESVTRAGIALMAAESPLPAAEADARLAQALGTLFAASEKYPKLTTSKQFQQLRQRIKDLESYIADSREFYNDSAAAYNDCIRKKPGAYMAKVLRFGPREMFAAGPGNAGR